MVNALRINPLDRVIMALCELPPNTPLEMAQPTGVLNVATRETIPFGHKVAIVAIAKGEPVLKYGCEIGVATTDIAPGEHVHTHNLRSVRGAARA